MSNKLETEIDSNVEIFKEKSIRFMEIAFYSMVGLTVIGAAFYLSVIYQNVQNSIPLMLLMFLAAYTWIMRAKLAQIEPKEIRVYLLQWLIISAIVIITSVLIVIFYPYSQLI